MNMKYTFLSLLFSVIFLGVNCQQNTSISINLPSISEEPKQEIQEENPPYQLVEVDAYASCFDYELQDNTGRTIELSPEIEDALICPTGALSLSPNGNMLLFDAYNSTTNYTDIKVYNFNTQQTTYIMSYLPDLEGVDCIWNELNTNALCGSVNQSRTDGIVKLHHFKFLGDTFQEKQRIFPPKEYPIAYVCGSVCTPSEIGFVNATTIRYLTQYHQQTGEEPEYIEISL